MIKTVVIGLGNTILSDDGAGVFVARGLRELLDETVEIVEAETAGMDLLEMLKDHERAIIIDAINLDGVAPGTVFRLKPDDLKITPRLASCHDIDIITALALGVKLGFEMPRDVTIFAIQGEDLLTLHEGCLPAVERSVKLLVEEIEALLSGSKGPSLSIPLEGRTGRDA